MPDVVGFFNSLIEVGYRMRSSLTRLSGLYFVVSFFMFHNIDQTHLAGHNFFDPFYGLAGHFSHTLQAFSYLARIEPRSPHDLNGPNST